jgi:uncharacterized membrane protein
LLNALTNVRVEQPEAHAGDMHVRLLSVAEAAGAVAAGRVAALDLPDVVLIRKCYAGEKKSKLGELPAMSPGGMLHTAFTTPEGRTLLLLGNGAGFLFALAVLVLTVVSVPMLIDRPVGIGSALGASVQACLANPGPMAVWGLIVAALLLLGSIPAFIGLAVVMPVLGHATWHLYKRVIV